MKRYVINMLLATPVFLSPQIVTADSSTIKHPIIKPEAHKKPLMASHLPEKLAKSLQLSSSLSYATGHRFYDTPIELVDEQGKKTHLKHQLNPQKQYKQVVEGAMIQATENIWFFSPTGVNPQQYDWDSCTFEAPCQQITQKLVDFVHEASSSAASFWIATGTYDLPTVWQKNLAPKLIDLYNDQIVMGRTSDFRHFAYDDERPLILGTLAWNGYSSHSGVVYGYASNLRMKAHNNDAQINDRITNTNLFSTYHLEVDNCDLKNSAANFAYNISANSLFIYDSNMKTKGYNGHNVYSAIVAMYSSNLAAQGLNASNIDASSASGASGDQLFVFDSNLLSEPDDCIGGNHGIYSNGSLIYLRDVNLEVRVKTRCESYGSMSVVDLGSEGQIMQIENSNISISAESSAVSGINSFNAPVYLDNSKISAQSRDAQALGIIATVIEFIGGSSYLFVSAPEASPFYTSDVPITVLNNSHPPSKCIINGETETCNVP